MGSCWGPLIYRETEVVNYQQPIRWQDSMGLMVFLAAVGKTEVVNEVYLRLMAFYTSRGVLAGMTTRGKHEPRFAFKGEKVKSNIVIGGRTFG